MIVSLAKMAKCDLSTVIRTDPKRRADAWAELKFRNQFQQAFETENGFQQMAPRAPVSMRLLTRVLPRWVAPDLSEPVPLGAGPLE